MQAACPAPLNSEVIHAVSSLTACETFVTKRKLRRTSHVMLEQQLVRLGNMLLLMGMGSILYV